MFELSTQITTIVYTAQAADDQSFRSGFFDFLAGVVQLIENVLFEVLGFIARFITSSDPLTIILLLTCALATLKVILRTRRLRYEAAQRRQQQPQS